MANGQVDAVQVMKPFLGDKTFNQSLRTVDVLNGCGHQCDVCLADAALPSKIFSEDSLQRLFSDGDFLQMLQPDSLRFGSSGDILDHPAALNIVLMVLDQTKPVDDFRMARERRHHQIKIFTNYRPHTEKAIDRLVEMALQNPDRLDVVISLPFNRKDVVNKKFGDYVKVRPGIFGEYSVGDDGLVKLYQTKIQNVEIQDVRHPGVLFMNGRILGDKANNGRVKDLDFVDRDGETEFCTRGFSKVYLNPDGFWLNLYTTPYESHTGRLFTILTPRNASVLTQTPFHPDFPTPPNWPGGRGIEKDFETAQREQQLAQGTKRMLPVNVVK
jgi:hypothetical protein